MRVWVATANRDKLKEIKRILEDEIEGIRVFSTLDLEEKIHILEDGKTLEENALKKARALFEKVREWTIADDTGLEVYALDMRPGVYSARYSGGGYRDNVEKLLEELRDKEDRRARFRTVFAVISPEGKEWLFEGICEGSIIKEPRGDGGFGYDPVFLPDGYTQTFAELNPGEKDRISHRGRALKKVVEFLRGVAQPG